MILKRLCFVLLACVGLQARALAAPVSGYFEGGPQYGTTYNGVTTDSGGHLPGSYELKARVGTGRYVFQYSYHSDLSPSSADATTASGGRGTALNYPGGVVIVPAFNANDGESEFRLEYRTGNYPLFVGLASSNSFNNYMFPRLRGVGFGVELQPNDGKTISPYGSYFFFPDQSGTYPLANPNDPASGPAHQAFDANEFEGGFSIALRPRGLSLALAYYQTTNVQKTGDYNFVRDGPVIALGYRFK
ncbi:MAG TPA: hypothetical protein VEJ41_04345 [Candidatus Acidoferrales bacterium]|nr:hypothetical protein [Candidatus Acidoferrales bacterium]